MNDGSRDLFLGRVRARLATEAPANLPHPLRPVDTVPAVRLRQAIDDPVASFEQVAAALGCTVVRAPDAPSQRALVDRVLAAHTVRTAIVSAEVAARHVAEALRAAGVVLADPRDRAAAAEADLGVTGSAWALASTGTLVLHPDQAGSRVISLLPPVHLAVVSQDAVLPDPSALFRRIPERFPSGLPSQIVLASGPSRSADIELELTVGVHGPGAVWVAIA